MKCFNVALNILNILILKTKSMLNTDAYVHMLYKSWASYGCTVASQQKGPWIKS